MPTALTANAYRSLTKLQRANVDKEKGLIRGVSIITQGAAKGHGMLIDGVTLDTVLECVRKMETGVKVKFNPATFEHGAGGIAGFIPRDSVRIEGQKLIGDVLVDEHFGARNYLLSLADKQPDTFGVSIDFMNEPEEVGGVVFARCVELSAATIVDEPACNSSGLFSVGVANLPKDNIKPKTTAAKTNLTTMTPDEMKAMLTEALAPTTATLSKLEARLAKLEATTPPPMTEEEMAAAGVEPNMTEDAKMSRVLKLREARTRPVTAGDLEAVVAKSMTAMFNKVGGRAASGSAPIGSVGRVDPAASDAKDPFLGKVRSHYRACGKLPLALARAAQDDKKGYNKYSVEVGSGDRKPITLEEVEADTVTA